MRSIVVGLALATIGCGKPAPKPLQGIQMIYELDLDKAIDDRMADVKRDLAASFADKKLAVTIRASMTKPGHLAITTDDPARSTEVRGVIEHDYRDVATAVDCAPAICLELTPSYLDTVRKAALEQAVTAIRQRIDQLHVTDPSVTARGEQIIIEVPGDPASAELVAVRNLIARSGTLEMKVVDDCSSPPTSGCTRAADHGGSPVMKRLYAHVPTDPEAQRAGVRADVDQWRAEEGGQHTDYYLRATTRAAIETYMRDLARRDPSFQLPDDRMLGFELVIPPPDAADHQSYWRSYYLERATRMTGRDISNATGSFDPNTNRPVVLLEFGRAGGQKFGDLTAEIVGMKLATMLDGTVKSAPIINGPIRGGRASITMGGVDAAAQERDRDELVVILKSGSLPAPLREVNVTLVGPSTTTP